MSISFYGFALLSSLNRGTIEIVHYATTFISEISSQYDEKLVLWETFEKGEADFDLLTEYCDFMEDYLSKELLSKQMEGLLRKEYEERLLQKLSHGTTAKNLVLDYS